MSLWLNSNGKIVWNGTNIIDCEICPCPGEGGHLSPCNGSDVVPNRLTLTIFFNSTSIDVELHWDAIACNGISEGWTYGASGDVELCPGIEFRDATLCCGLEDPDIWYFEFVWTDGGIQQSLTTISGIDALTINDTNPVDYETAIPGGLGGCIVGDVLLNFNPAP